MIKNKNTGPKQAWVQIWILEFLGFEWSPASTWCPRARGLQVPISEILQSWLDKEYDSGPQSTVVRRPLPFYNSTVQQLISFDSEFQ